jgi:hypothetical protein
VPISLKCISSYTEVKTYVFTLWRIASILHPSVFIIFLSCLTYKLTGRYYSTLHPSDNVHFLQKCFLLIWALFIGLVPIITSLACNKFTEFLFNKFTWKKYILFISIQVITNAILSVSANQEHTIPVPPMSNIFPIVNMDFQIYLNLQTSSPVILVLLML